MKAYCYTQSLDLKSKLNPDFFLGDKTAIIKACSQVMVAVNDTNDESTTPVARFKDLALGQFFVTDESGVEDVVFMKTTSSKCLLFKEHGEVQYGDMEPNRPVVLRSAKIEISHTHVGDLIYSKAEPKISLEQRVFALLDSIADANATAGSKTGRKETVRTICAEFDIGQKRAQAIYTSWKPTRADKTSKACSCSDCAEQCASEEVEAGGEAVGNETPAFVPGSLEDKMNDYVFKCVQEDESKKKRRPKLELVKAVAKKFEVTKVKAMEAVDLWRRLNLVNA